MSMQIFFQWCQTQSLYVCTHDKMPYINQYSECPVPLQLHWLFLTEQTALQHKRRFNKHIHKHYKLVNKHIHKHYKLVNKHIHKHYKLVNNSLVDFMACAQVLPMTT